MREPERPDLTPLDPRREPDRWERMVRHIMARSTGELQRRQAAGVFGLFDGLLAWSRPALATAAALTALSLFALSQLESRAQPTLFIRSASIPAAMSVWIEEGQPPSMLDLIVLANGEN
ncbi:MAG: hypothetical protein ACRENP_13890 [Longimicrobiales bacterium]